MAAGCNVRAYDPVASTEARRLLQQENGHDCCVRYLTLCDSARDAVEGSDALALVTEWKEFRAPDFEHLATSLRRKAIFDGRNLYDPKMVADAGIAYHGIGRRGHDDGQ
jgi:UDPglucose 6-dehydrogenase